MSLEKKLKLKHNSLFLFGVLFYFISPLVILQTDIFDGLPGIDIWKINRLDSSHFYTYLLLILEVTVAFILGSYLSYKLQSPRFSTNRVLGNITSKIVFS